MDSPSAASKDTFKILGRLSKCFSSGHSRLRARAKRSAPATAGGASVREENRLDKLPLILLNGISFKMREASSSRSGAIFSA